MAGWIDILQNKTPDERAELKSDYISKLIGINGKFYDTQYGFDIEIIGMVKIKGGVEVLAKAWKGRKRVGFGPDGSIEIERFKIFNPPVLVEDSFGDIIDTLIDNDGKIYARKLSFDPIKAIKQSLSHTVHLLGKIGSNPIIGKVGNTTATLYATKDGSIEYRTTNDYLQLSWATLRSTADGTGTASGTLTTIETRNNVTFYSSGCFNSLARAGYVFNTSSIPNGSTINSATFSIALYSKETWDSNTPGLNVFSFSPASDSSFAVGDYDAFGSTAFSTSIAYSSLTTGGYNDYALNSSGISGLNLGGNSRLGVRTSYDSSGSAPTGSANARAFRLYIYGNTWTGTTYDPKLVIDYVAAATGNFFLLFD